MGGHGVEGWIRTNKWGAQSHRALDAPRFTISPLPHTSYKSALIHAVPAMSIHPATIGRVPTIYWIIELNGDASIHIDYANDRPDIPSARTFAIVIFICVLYAVSHCKVGQGATPPIRKYRFNGTS